MARITAGFLVLVAMSCPVSGGFSGQSTTLNRTEWVSALRGIVESEKAFARAAGEKGTREAFLAFLDEDAVLFRPQPVPGRKWLLDHPPAAGILSWRPVYAYVSAAGDLGYTTGPYEFRKQASDGIPSSYGNYFTIWKKQPDGGWKVLIDYGTSNPPPDQPAPDFNPSREKPPAAPRPRVQAGGIPDDLMGLDRRLSNISAASGAAALRSSVADEARFLRADLQPVIGKEKVCALFPAQPGAWTWEPIKSGVSNSGDLGFTYGTFRLQPSGTTARPAQSGYYLRVWKRQPGGTWRIVVDVVNT